MKIPSLSLFAIFALIGMTLAMDGYGYGSYGYGGYGGGGYGASYMPVSLGHGQSGSSLGGSGICKCVFLLFKLQFWTLMRSRVDIKMMT